jgi:hypothetical protein
VKGIVEITNPSFDRLFEHRDSTTKEGDVSSTRVAFSGGRWV